MKRSAIREPLPSLPCNPLRSLQATSHGRRILLPQPQPFRQPLVNLVLITHKTPRHCSVAHGGDTTNLATSASVGCNKYSALHHMCNGHDPFDARCFVYFALCRLFFSADRFEPITTPATAKHTSIKYSAVSRWTRRKSSPAVRCKTASSNRFPRRPSRCSRRTRHTPRPLPEIGRAHV